MTPAGGSGGRRHQGPCDGCGKTTWKRGNAARWCPDCRRLRQKASRRKWVLSHRQENREYRRAAYRRDPEKARARGRAYYHAHPEYRTRRLARMNTPQARMEARRRQRRWRLNNPEYCRLRCRLWYWQRQQRFLGNTKAVRDGLNETQARLSAWRAGRTSQFVMGDVAYQRERAEAALLERMRAESRSELAMLREKLHQREKAERELLLIA